MSITKRLSSKAKAIWGKTPQGNDKLRFPEGSYLPLFKHLSDSVEIAKLLWENWISSVSKIIIHPDVDIAKAIFLFLVALHDGGKATPEFEMKDEAMRQRLEHYGIYIKNISKNMVPHPIASQYLLEKFLMGEPYFFKENLARSYAVVIGGHHGMSPKTDALDDIETWTENIGINDPVWESIQNEFIECAIDISGIELKDIREHKLSVSAQAILTGLVIMVDWLASDASLFPYETIESPRKESSNELAIAAWERLHFSPRWSAQDNWTNNSPEDFFGMRFKNVKAKNLRPVQAETLEIVSKLDKPGIIVIEASMGEGKTEAALLAAEVLAAKTGRSGLFFALPTQATSDGLFPRIEDWIETFDGGGGYTINLAHGKSRLNEDFKGIARVSVDTNTYEDTANKDGKFAGEEPDSVVVHEWFDGRKKGLLADFVVGTIDQVLMAALMQRHLALRHLGLFDKVVVIDECHAYDAYMSEYLERALQWLGSYGVPVIVLSATLPEQKRNAVINAYLDIRDTTPFEPWKNPGAEITKDQEEKPNTITSYPLISYSDGKDLFHKAVKPSGRGMDVGITFIDETTDLREFVEELLVDGGCIAIIQNTVNRARNVAIELCGKFGEANVTLFHSQFLSADRIAQEKKLRGMLGPGGNRPEMHVVVGTQVLEQSLDVDFDYIITDICPIDLLLQRIGRLHRHERNSRPKALMSPQCAILGCLDKEDAPDFDKGSEYIYYKYILEGTYALLKERKEIKVPNDIPVLVQEVYQEGGACVPDEWKAGYSNAKKDYKRNISNKKEKADTFRIRDINNKNDLTGWIDTPAGNSDAQGEATVRDTSDSLEVIVVQKTNDNQIAFLPWINDGNEFGNTIPIGYTPDNETAAKLAECTINLPSILCMPWIIDRVITELENSALPYIEAWQASKWLKGALVLILDENLEAEIELAGREFIMFKLKYERKWGLSVERIKEDGN